MIVSIYLKEHEYLNTCGQTFNFGGKYIYSFEEHGKKILVKRTLNKKYISDFFNISESSCKVNLLSAIVGENGVGKSSILDIIRDIFSKGFAHNSSIILVEENEETKILYSNIDVEICLLQEEKEIKLKRADREHYQSIYYSPHFDLKYHPNFDEIDPYDISLDKYIQKDLENIDKKGTNESGWKYPPHEELKFKESMRQIKLMQSPIFKNNSVFREIFNLPEYKMGVLYFRETNIDYDNEGKVEFWNTPKPLESIIQLILDKIEEEYKEWYHIRIFDNNNVTNQEKVNKYLLERYVIECFMTTIINQMEKHNTRLTEAKMTEPYQEERFKSHSAKDVFLYFIKESFISNEEDKIFKYEIIERFIEKLYTLFEKEKNPDKITKQSIWLDLSELEEILELHHKIITNLFHYYPKDEDKIDKMNYVEGFLSYRPTDRNMSSGETATLNFFSKLYDFIDMNLVEERQFLSNRQNYILLLDEADLGFHPIWKKKYVNAILKALPHFFENLTPKPNLQIIITTHDPLTLSDIPLNNVIFLQRQGNSCGVVSGNDKIQKTFGANITDLLAHSFFVGDGLIGDFAKSKIEETITWINKNKTNKGENFEEELEYHKKVINLIDERVLRLKLTEMITDLVHDNEYYNQALDDEITKLNQLRK